MTTIVLGPTDALSDALAADAGGVVVIDGSADADEMMWQVLVALQGGHASMAGRIVVVLPTIGMAGAAGMVDYTTAIEGIRAMAKSAARQWGPEGIGVNIVAAPVHLFAHDIDASHLTAAAVQDDGALTRSVVETTKFLLRSDLHHLTGQTVVVDGGSVMLP